MHAGLGEGGYRFQGPAHNLLNQNLSGEGPGNWFFKSDEASGP